MSGVGQLRGGDPLDYRELKYLAWQNPELGLILENLYDA
jgi:hypothetical protein